jgi:hypothetical protein
MKLLSIAILLLTFGAIYAQTTKINLSGTDDESIWKIHNREISTLMAESGKIDAIGFNAQQGDGIAIYEDLEFENGTLELDIKGKDVMQRSFVGIAFHIQDEESFNAIYFRPFNFNIPERSGHSVQYISHPEFTWRKLRTDFPEQFENPVTPVPDPNNWFHVKIVVEWPTVKVFVENSNEPSLDVKMKSTFKKGKVGFWAGNGSDGWYKNLVVTKM